MDNLDKFARATGISKAEILAMADQIRANFDTLAACKGHEFEPEEFGAALRKKYKCRVCGGYVESIAYRWYNLGRAHGHARALKTR